jgi:hypothetical protein
MGAIRRWAVFDVLLGNPVLVERCATKEEALRVAALRRPPSSGGLYVIEQLLPDRALKAAPAAPRGDFHGTTG